MTVLFLSQDGIADHIGQSQIAPYVLGLAAAGHDIHVLSAEKTGREAVIAEYADRFAAAGVRWTRIRYHKPLAGTLRDLAAMTLAARRIARRENIDLVHCRSHPPMPVALAVKRWTCAKVLFDVRDLWADTGIAKGRFVPVYRWFKRRERGFVEGADHVNCLAERAAAHLRDQYPGQTASWSVIPCCADFHHFKPDPDAAAEVRRNLNIPGNACVLLYLGSIGPDYLLDQMMALFAQLRTLRSDAVFLMLVNNAAETIERVAAAAGVPISALRITNVPRARVPAHIAAADMSVVFRADISKLACSPTKMGETLACGVPFIANSGIGDLDEMLSLEVNGSIVLPDLEPETMCSGLEQVLEHAMSSEDIRTSALALSLEAGIYTYSSVYETLGARAC
jgi:glycosyltransferase involved in cell wall biosynthesis